MFVLRKTTNEEKLLAILEARYKENQSNPQKMKGMMARMQALQQMQQQQMEAQRKKQQELNRKKNR
jgi:YidC/Oxa1 family membrane protein insertase